ncbi:MAG: hypothetical protein K1Y02_12790 [Candidatus Hydrogenedentes bacterium]|nr:hypothetical protein [Candidatus Hydrogenedentota bacterium]
MEVPEQSIPEPVEETRVPPRSQSLSYAAVILVLAGVLVMLCLGVVESNEQKTQVWRNAVVVAEGKPFWDGVIPARFRMIREEDGPFYPLVQEILKQPNGAEILKDWRFDMREYVVAVSMPDSEWAPLVESGRVPEPGKPEVLAGPMCRFDRFTLDGVEFKVVGKLQRGTAGLSFAYLLPDSGDVMRLFEDSRGATHGWIDKDASNREWTDAQQSDESTRVLLASTPAQPMIARGVFVGLLFVILGGAILQVRLLQAFCRRTRIFATLIDSTHTHARLFRAVHICCYGALLLLMMIGFAFPLVHRLALLMVNDLFTRGDLAYIGNAYMSQNILHATVATFINNYIVQTLSITMIPSLLVPIWGLLKTMLNLAIAGFVLAPVYTDIALRFAFHSITVSLEVEAYVIAAYATLLYGVHLYRGLTKGSFTQGAILASKIMLEAVALTGILLFIAAGYEAVTLILMS